MNVWVVALFTLLQLSWTQAYLSCRRMNMFLATFHNMQEYERLRAVLEPILEESK